MRKIEEVYPVTSPLKKTHRAYLIKFLEGSRNLNKSEHTLVNYRSDLYKFLTWLEYRRIKVTKVTPKTIGEYKDFLTQGGRVTKKSSWWSYFLIFGFFFQRNSLVGKGLSVSSRKRHLSTLKNFFEYLVQSEHGRFRRFKDNPVKTKLHSIRLKEIDVVHTPLLTAKDWRKLEEKTYKLKDRLLIYLLYWGGLRLRELTVLKFDQFDDKNLTLTFNRKGGYRHTITLQKAHEIFSLLKKCNDGESTYLFQGSAGKPISAKGLYNRIMKLLKKAHIKDHVTPHSFRKACATMLYKETKDLLYVRDYLNHKDAKVTQTYIDPYAYKLQQNAIQSENNIIQ